MTEWIELHYKLIIKIVVPIIIAIIGLFKIRKMLKNHAKGNNNIQMIAEKDVNNTDSFKATNQTNQSGIQIAGNNNQINNLDLNAVKSMAVAFNMTMFPHTERG
jgi:amino acid transporter